MCEREPKNAIKLYQVYSNRYSSHSLPWLSSKSYLQGMLTWDTIIYLTYGWVHWQPMKNTEKGIVLSYIRNLPEKWTLRLHFPHTRSISNSSSTIHAKMFVTDLKTWMANLKQCETLQLEETRLIYRVKKPSLSR